MSCECSDPSDFECTGGGAHILAHTTLPWFLTTDKLLGTTEAGVPNGNVNQLFWKLLQNDCSIVTFIHNAFTRTFGVSDTAAPAVNTVPDPLAGAPATPTGGAIHTVIYNNFEVTYRYDLDTALWVEVARMARTLQVAAIVQKKITIPLNEGDTEVPITIPTTDDNDNAFAFTMDDLALFYVNNLDEAAPIVSVVPGFTLAGAVLRVVLSSEIEADTDYELVVIFRRTTLN